MKIVKVANSVLVGWLIVMSLTAFSAVFQFVLGCIPERGRKEREMTDERKMSKQPPPTPVASTVTPCPTIFQIRRTP